MSLEAHHHDALIETARLELDRAHRAILAAEAAEMRRALELAAAALREAGEAGPAASVAAALAELEGGDLTEMASRIEAMRKALDQDGTGLPPAA